MKSPFRLVAHLSPVALCAALCAGLCAGLIASPVPALAGEDGSGAFTEPALIDRAVADFTGAAIGEVGGARMQADRRLRLARCAQPLEVSWHGHSQTTVAIACAGPTSWRIFMSLNAARAAAAVSQKVVERGDPITVAVKGRGFTVQQSGTAMEDGSIGDWVAIRTDRDAEPIRARIERPGLAVIPVG